MSLKSEIAKTASRSVLGDISAWFGRLGRGIGTLVEGSWVQKSTFSATTKISEKTFANGVHLVEKPGAAAVATQPARWLSGKEPLHRQLIEGSLVVRTTYSASTKVSQKTMANGVKVVEAPGKAAVVTLPQRWLTGGVSKL